MIDRWWIILFIKVVIGSLLLTFFVELFSSLPPQNFFQQSIDRFWAVLTVVRDSIQMRWRKFEEGGTIGAKETSLLLMKNDEARNKKESVVVVGIVTQQLTLLYKQQPSPTVVLVHITH